ncbi:hypothetical protein LSAT2_032278, partial [Lamellibrachia satsuma]
LPVVLGTLLGLVLLILLVIPCIFILCCRGRGKNTIIEDSPEHDSSLYYSSLGPMRQMIWQQRTPTMMSPSNAKVSEHERERMNNAEGAQYERERMNIVCRAVALVSSSEFRVPPVSSFARRNVRSQADVLQRSGRYERRGGEKLSHVDLAAVLIYNDNNATRTRYR